MQNAFKLLEKYKLHISHFHQIAKHSIKFVQKLKLSDTNMLRYLTTLVCQDLELNISWTTNPEATENSYSSVPKYPTKLDNKKY